jgi:hypothetical protein
MRTLNESFYISGSKSNVFFLGNFSALGNQNFEGKKLVQIRVIFLIFWKKWPYFFNEKLRWGGQFTIHCLAHNFTVIFNMFKNVFTCQVSFKVSFKKYDVSIISKNVNYLQEKTKMFMIDFFHVTTPIYDSGTTIFLPR